MKVFALPVTVVPSRKERSPKKGIDTLFIPPSALLILCRNERSPKKGIDTRFDQPTEKFFFFSRNERSPKKGIDTQYWAGTNY